MAEETTKMMVRSLSRSLRVEALSSLEEVRVRSQRGEGWKVARRAEVGLRREVVTVVVADSAVGEAGVLRGAAVVDEEEQEVSQEKALGVAREAEGVEGCRLIVH